MLFYRSYAAIFAASLLISSESIAAPGGFEVLDRHDRVLNDRAITLVDWDGQIANPAILLKIRPPDNTPPFQATLTANGSRIYLELPSSAGPSGPSKTIQFDGTGNAVVIHASIWGDRDTNGESYTFTVSGAGFATNLPVLVLDQDLDTQPSFKVNCDFFQDRPEIFQNSAATTFFADPLRRQVFCRAANDWAYFIDDMHLDQVAVDQELSGAWDSKTQRGFEDFIRFRNKVAFTGFLLYGNTTTFIPQSPEEPPGIGGGGAIEDQPGQSRAGVPLIPKLCRSGGVSLDTLNPPESDWQVSLNDEDWWKKPGGKDLLGFVTHESGHALAFSGHQRFKEFLLQGRIDDQEISTYLGHQPAVHSSAHLHDNLGIPEIDVTSQLPAFGAQGGRFPVFRWTITKLDILVFQAIGYTLRRTSATTPLAINSATLRAAPKGLPYSDAPSADGGIPAYSWQVTQGSLPPGLVLDSFTGNISGTPMVSGAYPFELTLQDGDNTAPSDVVATQIIVTNTVPISASSMATLAILLVLLGALVLHGWPRAWLSRIR